MVLPFAVIIRLDGGFGKTIAIASHAGTHSHAPWRRCIVSPYQAEQEGVLNHWHHKASTTAPFFDPHQTFMESEFNGNAED